MVATVHTVSERTMSPRMRHGGIWVRCTQSKNAIQTRTALNNSQADVTAVARTGAKKSRASPMAMICRLPTTTMRPMVQARDGCFLGSANTSQTSARHARQELARVMGPTGPAARGNRPEPSQVLLLPSTRRRDRAAHTRAKTTRRRLVDQRGAAVLAVDVAEVEGAVLQARIQQTHIPKGANAKMASCA